MRLLHRFLCLLLLATPSAGWAAHEEAPAVQLHFFWSLTCPHCRAAHPHVEALARERPWIQLQALEISREPDNLARYEAMAQALGEEAASVPAFLFCGEMHTGWGGDETTGALLRQRLDACHAQRLAGTPVPAAPPAVAAIRVPLLGELDPASLSLPVLTLVLAGLDAFNPCAFFVLLFLLSSLARLRSRARMLAVGGLFVLVSGLMYFAFMAAWLNVFRLFGHLAPVTLAAGLLALGVGLIDVKDFFRFGSGPTLSISAADKADLYRRTRLLAGTGGLAPMLLAATALAIAANFYELLCTAGFPMVYTRLLTQAEPGMAQRYAWLAAYNLIYVLPLAAIVIAFARTLGARKLSERDGRLLKLLAGLMMSELGLVLLLAPEWLTHPGAALALMAVAAGLTWAASRRVSPPA